jgi:hypothetical protein
MGIAYPLEGDVGRLVYAEEIDVGSVIWYDDRWVMVTLLSPWPDESKPVGQRHAPRAGRYTQDGAGPLMLWPQELVFVKEG